MKLLVLNPVMPPEKVPRVQNVLVLEFQLMAAPLPPFVLLMVARLIVNLLEELSALRSRDPDPKIVL